MKDAATRSWTLALLAGILAVGLSDFASAEFVPTYRDLAFFFLPAKHFLGEALVSGDLPLWNPWVQMGVPFLAGLQTGVLYPPSALLVIRPFALGFNLFVLAHFAIGATGAWLWLRRDGATPAAAAIGVAVFVLGGTMVSLVNVLNVLQAASWAPWVAWALPRTVARPSPARVAVLALVWALQILAGAPEILVLTAVTVAFVTLSAPVSSVPGWLAVAVAGGLSLAMTAVQLAPTLEFASRSERFGGLSAEQVMTWSLHPGALLEILVPRFAIGLIGFAESPRLAPGTPWIRSLYVGVLPLVLVAAGLLRARRASSSGLLWGLVAAGGLLLALGHHAPFFPWLHSQLPSAVGLFRFPEKFFFVVHLAVALLAARGADQLLAGERSSLRSASGAVCAVAVVLGVVYFLAAAPSTLSAFAAFFQNDLEAPALAGLAESLRYGSARSALLLLGGTVVVALRHRRRLSNSLAAALAVALVGGDLAYAHVDLHSTVRWRSLFESSSPIDVAALRAAETRVFQYDRRRSADSPPGFVPWEEQAIAAGNPADATRAGWPTLLLNVGMVYGVGAVDGGVGIERRDHLDLLHLLSVVPRSLGVELLRRLGVELLSGRESLAVAALTPVGHDPRVPWFAYRIANPVPLVAFVGRVTIADTDFDTLNRWIAPDFDPTREVILAAAPEGWREQSEWRPPAPPQVRRPDVDRLVIDVDLPYESIVVIRERQDPGWRAAIDGEVASILAANGYSRAVVVPAGTHRIEFEYAPRSMRYGALVSTLSLLAWGGCFWLGRRERSS